MTCWFPGVSSRDGARGVGDGVSEAGSQGLSYDELLAVGHGSSSVGGESCFAGDGKRRPTGRERGVTCGKCRVEAEVGYRFDEFLDSAVAGFVGGEEKTSGAAFAAGPVEGPETGWAREPSGFGCDATSAPDRTETAAVAEDYSGCGSDLADGTDVGMSWTQVWDTPAIRLEKVHYLLPRGKCRCCQKITTAAVPFGQAGTVTYGPKRECRGDSAGLGGQRTGGAHSDADGGLVGVAGRPGSSRAPMNASRSGLRLRVSTTR